MNDEQNGSREAAHDLELWLVHALEQLPGVLAAAVWLADLRTVRAVHVTAAPGASITILGNATTRVLRKHGLEFERGAIQVAYHQEPQRAAPAATSAPTAAPAGARPPVAGPSRPAQPTPQELPTIRFLLLHDMSIQRAGSRVTCTVQVERGPAVFEGEAMELDTESGRARAAARATLTAAERAEEQLALGLEGALVLDMFGRRYVATSVEAAVNRRFALLAGLVPVDPARSLEEAACLSALRAIDRWIAI
ncbi:MAG: hypothetical protein L0271_10845 [Gemmatimonadetes bacterium]|nr:hypothetical protein [Gemmatimonadota bacterium]